MTVQKTTKSEAGVKIPRKVAMPPPTLVRRSTDTATMAASLATIPPNPVSGAITPPAAMPQEGVFDIANLHVGQICEAPVSCFSETDLNARVFYVDEEIDDMAHSLQQYGQEVPVKAFIANGILVIVDGQKRLRGAKAGGIAKLRVEICEPPQQKDLYLQSRRINTERSQQSVFDDAIRFRQLIDGRVFANQSELGEAVGMDQSMVSRVMRVCKIHHSFMRRMREHGNLNTLDAAVAISMLFDDDGRDHSDVDLLLDQAIRENLSAKQLSAKVQAMIAGPRSRAPRSQSAVLKWHGHNATLKSNPSKGAFSLVVAGLPAELVEEIERKVRSMLEQQAE